MDTNSEITCPEQLVNTLSKIPDAAIASTLNGVLSEAFDRDPNYARAKNEERRQYMIDVFNKSSRR